MTFVKIISFTITVVALSILVSCTTYKLNDSDLIFNPYKVNDILVFRNHLNEDDTVIITSVERYTNPADPLSFFADHTETLFVIAKHGDRSDEFLKISRTKDSVYIDYSLNLKDAMFNGAFLTDVELRRSKPETVSLFGEEYSNVVKVYSPDKEKQYDLVKSIYWSNEYGYVKAEMSNGRYWYLVERIRK